MAANEYLPWLTLAALGAFHGINPGMGWLFAVALGLQERRRQAVIRALGPIAIGHLASVAIVVALIAVAQVWVDPDFLRLLSAAALVGFGVYKLVGPMSHPRWVSMRVRGPDLVIWSFLMASAHGAGLMLAPVLLELPAAFGPEIAAAQAGHEPMVSTPGSLTLWELAAVGVHSLAMYVAMGAVALAVFDKVGLAILRRAWFNLDRVWALALITGGVVTAFA